MDKNLNDEENTLNQELFGMVNRHSSASNYVDANYGRNAIMPKDFRKNATPGKDTSTDKPRYPHTPVSPASPKSPKRTYKATNSIKRKSGKKLPKPLVFLIAAGVLAGGIKAVTLGIDYINSTSRDNSLAESQENLVEMSNTTSLGNIETYQQEDNSLEILNTDLNNLIQKYKESPNSITQEEVRSLLGVCYQEGRSVVFSKMAEAYNSYSLENENFSNKIDAQNLIYRKSNGKDNMTPYFIANCPDSVNNPNGTALPSNNELSDFISTQIKIKNLYLSNQDTSLDIAKSLNLLKQGVSDINNFYTLKNFSIEDNFMGGKKLVINEYEKNTDSLNYDTIEEDR